MKSRAAFAAILILAVPAFAERAGSMSTPSAPRTIDARTQAVMDYESGRKRLDKIAALHEQLKSAEAKEAEKIQTNIRKHLERAAGDFKRAVANSPTLFQAHSELGFALRKLGKFDDSLAAYDRALQLEPAFAPAIEYRAEAYLGLNRIDEAKEAYGILIRSDRARADALFAAMKEWVSARRADPSGVDAQSLEQFAKWVEQRAAVHTTASTSGSW
jgi:tetratricopeptide (TPR) repeat protein